jgi:hypothetical protein
MRQRSQLEEEEENWITKERERWNLKSDSQKWRECFLEVLFLLVLAVACIFLFGLTGSWLQ